MTAFCRNGNTIPSRLQTRRGARKWSRARGWPRRARGRAELTPREPPRRARRAGDVPPRFGATRRTRATSPTLTSVAGGRRRARRRSGGAVGGSRGHQKRPTDGARRRARRNKRGFGERRGDVFVFGDGKTKRFRFLEKKANVQNVQEARKGTNDDDDDDDDGGFSLRSSPRLRRRRRRQLARFRERSARFWSPSDSDWSASTINCASLARDSWPCAFARRGPRVRRVRRKRRGTAHRETCAFRRFAGDETAGEVSSKDALLRRKPKRFFTSPAEVAL